MYYYQCTKGKAKGKFLTSSFKWTDRVWEAIPFDRRFADNNIVPYGLNSHRGIYINYNN